MTTVAQSNITDESPAAASAALMSMIFGFQATHALYVAAELDLAGLLSNGPKTIDELADKTGTRAPLLYRLMRALASIGVFTEGDDGRFAMTPLAEPLRGDARGGSVRDYARLVGQPFAQRPWEQLLSTLQTGKTAFELLHGTPLFEYLANDAEANAIFNAAMTSTTSREADAVVAAYDFGHAGTIVDVGGGHGTLIAAILNANPETSGVLFELPNVIASAGTALREAGTHDRCTLIEGDMFATVPAGGDAYVLKHIVHDWGDAHARTVLNNCRDALDAGGRVLVIEQVVPPGNDPHPSKFYDLLMLVVLGGRERTEAELRELFASAGLELTRIIPTPSPVSIIEGKRI